MKKLLWIVMACSLTLTFAHLVVFTPFAMSAPKKLVIATNLEPDVLDFTIMVTGPATYPIGENIYETLVDKALDGKRVPGLASWTVSPDGKLIEFTLRKGIKFHSGDPLTTKDIVFTWTRAAEKNPTWKRRLQPINMEIVDDYRIKLHFKEPDAIFLPYRAYLPIESKSYYDRVGEDKFIKNPVGTGPYKFVTWESGQYIDLKANEEYWRGAPSVKEVRFRIVKEDTTRVAMLKTGEADIILDVPWKDVASLRSAGFKTVTADATPPCSIKFHLLNPKVPWYDKRVRQAIAYAIDSKAIIDKLFHGIPNHVARLASWEIGYDPELKPYPYDPEKAKKLLAEAGYPKGFEMPFYYMTGRSYGIKETAEAAALYLKAVGINCKVEGLESVKFVKLQREVWHNSTDVEAVIGADPGPGPHYFEPTEAIDLMCNSKSLYSLYSNPNMDALIAEMQRTLDDTKRGELIKKACRMLQEELPTIVIWATRSVYGMKPNIDFTPVQGIGWVYMHANDVRVKD